MIPKGLILLAILCPALPALAAKPEPPPDLIELGRQLFTKETFDGNGRTCASCHPLNRNTTLSIRDIAELPDSDPLFAAEFTPGLQGTVAYRRFEEPALMRQNAVICENVKGFDQPCRMRSIPHTLALRTSTKPVPGDVGPGVHALGWGGDGAPGDRSLRSFALGAVRQHFPKTLARREGIDFRLPTDIELDALEAFQFSLGRQSDPVLPLAFLDPVVARGQLEFLRPDEENGAVFCENCHENGGAHGTLQQANRMNKTGIEQAIGRPNQVIAASVGLLPLPFDDGPGTGRFNAPPLVEAAFTAPFFHDNALRTLEAAVAHYTSDAFRDHNGHPQVHLSAMQVESMAAFIRVLGALEKLRSADAHLVSAGMMKPPAAKEEIVQASNDLRDAARVLDQGELHPQVMILITDLLSGKIKPKQISEIREIIAKARAQIVVE